MTRGGSAAPPAAPGTDPDPRRGIAAIADRAGLAILATFVALATLSSLVFPIFEAPDEYSHFQYARLLAQGRGLPVQTDPELRSASEGFNPPLGYVAPALVLAAFDPQDGAGIAVPPRLDDADMVRLAETWTGLPPLNPDFVWWGRGQDRDFFRHPPGQALASPPLLYVNLMRLTSVLCGLATLLGLMQLTRAALPNDPVAGLAALALVAFNPQFIYISGSLNSDNLVTAFATWTLWRLCVVWRRAQATDRDAIVLGVLLSLGTLAKTNMLFLMAPAIVLLWLRSTGWRHAARHVAILAGVMLLLAGWFFARNAWLYGGWDFLGWRTRAALQPEFLIPEPLRRHFGAFVLNELLPTAHASFWGWFGWLTVRMHDWQYTIYRGLSLLAVVSLRDLLPGGARARRGVLLLAWSCLGLNVISLVSFNLTFLAHQGRLLFPSIGAVGLLLGAGASTLLRPLGDRAALAVVLTLATGLAALVVYTGFSILRPVYF